MRDRSKRRNKPSGRKDAAEPTHDANQPAPLQPTFLDRDSGYSQSAPAEPSLPEDRQPVYEAQPEADPQDQDHAADEQPEQAPAQAANRRDRSRNRGRGGRNRNRQRQGARPPAPALPIDPGQATGEAAEVEGVPPTVDTGAGDSIPEIAATPKPSKREKAPKGAVTLAIGLPGSGKSSWFRRHNIIPLSSDLVRGLLFDDPTEQRFQDLVFSTLRYMLRMRLVAGRPMNYIDATNLAPKERHSWIKMARDFGFEAHAVFFDVPTEVCMERNRKRSRNVPDEVMLRMANKLKPPKFDEGFAKITIVRLKSGEKREPAREPAVEPEAEAEEE